MKAVIFSYEFRAPDELKKFCESIGYVNTDYRKNYDLIFDSRVVEFCEQRLYKSYFGMLYRGRPNGSYRVGYSGAGFILNIDTSRKWVIEWNNYGIPSVRYVDVNVNGYGHVNIIKYDE